MRARVVTTRKGPSVEVPAALLRQARIMAGDHLDARLTSEGLLLSAGRKPRQGWAAAARRVRSTDADLHIPLPPPAFDDEEWEW